MKMTKEKLLKEKMKIANRELAETYKRMELHAITVSTNDGYHTRYYPKEIVKQMVSRMRKIHKLAKEQAKLNGK